MSDSNFGHLVWVLQYVTCNDLFTWSTSYQPLARSLLGWARPVYCWSSSNCL